jgi:hypothetical protein
MEETISDNPKVLESSWEKLPRLMIYGSTLPSALLWLGIILSDPGPVVAIIMILTFGIPTKLLHQIYQRINLLRLKQPSTLGHIFFFIGQCATYLLAGTYAL